MKSCFLPPLFAALLLSSGCKPSGAGVASYGTAPATRGDLVQHVTATGSLSAVVSVDVGSQVSGKIVALYADFNSIVTNGELVAEIDPATYAAMVAEAKADLANSRAALALAKVTLERDAALLSKNIVAQADYDSAKASCEQAEAMVMIKQATVDQDCDNLGYCKITAPVDGMVISRKVDVGQTVIAAMSTPVLFTIAQDVRRMIISASVSESDIGQVRSGQAVTFTVDAFPDEIFQGTVTQVRRAPTTTQNVVTYETIITVDNPEQKLFPGMTADVSILVAERKNVLKIPNTALRFTPPDGAKIEPGLTVKPGSGQEPASSSADGPKSEPTPAGKLGFNQRLVYSPGKDPGVLKPLFVKIGLTDGVDTEVLAGLNEGQPVVTASLSSGVRPGGFGGPPPPQ